MSLVSPKSEVNFYQSGIQWTEATLIFYCYGTSISRVNQGNKQIATSITSFIIQLVVFMDLGASLVAFSLASGGGYETKWILNAMIWSWLIYWVFLGRPIESWLNWRLFGCFDPWSKEWGVG